MLDTAVITQYNEDDPHATLADAAAFFECHPDSIQRAFRRDGKVSPWIDQDNPRRNSKITPEILARMKELAADGMPATWIAESVNVAPESVRHYLGPRPDVAPDWRPVWQAIRRDIELAKLHREFAPSGSTVGLTRTA